MPVRPEVEIEGLKDLQRQLRGLDPALAKELKDINLSVAELVADISRQKVPRGETGNARASLKAKGEQRYAVVKAGGRKAPYFGFLNYGNVVGRGGAVGRNDSVPRKFDKTGRFIWPVVMQQRDKMVKEYALMLGKLLDKAGL